MFQNEAKEIQYLSGSRCSLPELMPLPRTPSLVDQIADLLLSLTPPLVAQTATPLPNTAPSILDAASNLNRRR